MSINDFSTLVQTIVIAATLIFTIFATRLNVKWADSAEKRAAKNIDILANGLESISRSLKESSSQAFGVRWQLTRDGKNSFRLENVGDSIARRVEIITHETLPLFQLPVMPIYELAPNEIVCFSAIRTFGTLDATVKVVWENEFGEKNFWARPLPIQSP